VRGCACACVRVRTCVRVCVCMCRRVYVCVRACVRVRVFMCVFACAYMCVSVPRPAVSTIITISRAQFETVEDATSVRKRIEGLRWPSCGKVYSSAWLPGFKSSCPACLLSLLWLSFLALICQFLHVDLVEANLLAGQAATVAAAAPAATPTRLTAVAREASASSAAAAANTIVPGDGDLRWQLSSRSREARPSLGGASTAATQGDGDRDAGRAEEPDTAVDGSKDQASAAEPPPVGQLEPPPPVRQLDELFRKTAVSPV
jgi:hypothetical protein